MSDFRGRVGHHLTLAAPLLGILALTVIAGGIVSFTVRLGEPIAPSGSLTAAIGDGLDELFRARPMRALERVLHGHDSAMKLTAFSLCALAAVATLHSNASRANGINDGLHALTLVRMRLAAFAGGSRRHAWGCVRDADTGAPLAFARISLVDEHHNELAVAVSDHDGVYGFAVPLGDALSVPYAVGLATTKDGYHLFRKPLSLRAGALPDTLDIGLESR